MYILQIRYSGDSEWRTYYKYYKYYFIALLAYIKAKFDLLFINDIELRIYKVYKY